MAGQAHYTSAPPSAGARHGGFRFTAVSPSARPALEVLRPLTGYVPPPGTFEPAECPVAFAYDRPGPVVFTRTRCTGKDYTGRPGNHFCHALYATADELAGLRPVELWDTPQWAAGPAGPTCDGEQPLPDVTELVPGSALGPDRVRRLLDGTGERGADLLARLLTVALGALAGEGPGATLVTAEPDAVVDWIAAVSYTLPAGLAAQLTFTTYAGRPEDDTRHLTGTLPRTADRAGGPVLDLDGLTAHGCPEPCATARFLAGAWGSGCLDDLDLVADVWDAGPPGPSAPAGVRRLRVACALLSEDVGTGTGAGLTAFVRAVAELLPQAAAVAPESLPQAAAVAPERLAAAAARHLTGHAAPLGDVAAALAPLPEPYRGAVLTGLLAALEASADTRAGALDPAACASLASLTDTAPEAFAAAPRTALHVLRLSPGEPREAALRILRLYRQGLLEETETYEAVRDVVRSERPERPERAPRVPWRRGRARDGE